MTNSYSLKKHRHRFALWAAARAAQRGWTRTDAISLALCEGKISDFSDDLCSRAFNQAEFDKRHADLCCSIMENLQSKNIAKVTFGRVAKLVAIYFKVTVVLNDGCPIDRKHAIHPPIDRILLTNLQAKKIVSCLGERGNLIAWTDLNKQDYISLISKLRGVLADADGFWKLEEYWGKV